MTIQRYTPTNKSIPSTKGIVLILLGICALLLEFFNVATGSIAGVWLFGEIVFFGIPLITLIFVVMSLAQFLVRIALHNKVGHKKTFVISGYNFETNITASILSAVLGTTLLVDFSTTWMVLYIQMQATETALPVDRALLLTPIPLVGAFVALSVQILITSGIYTSIAEEDDSPPPSPNKARGGKKSTNNNSRTGVSSPSYPVRETHARPTVPQGNNNSRTGVSSPSYPVRETHARPTVPQGNNNSRTGVSSSSYPARETTTAPQGSNSNRGADAKPSPPSPAHNQQTRPNNAPQRGLWGSGALSRLQEVPDEFDFDFED